MVEFNILLLLSNSPFVFPILHLSSFCHHLKYFIPLNLPRKLCILEFLTIKFAMEAICCQCCSFLMCKFLEAYYRTYIEKYGCPITTWLVVEKWGLLRCLSWKVWSLIHICTWSQIRGWIVMMLVTFIDVMDEDTTLVSLGILECFEVVTNRKVD